MACSYECFQEYMNRIEKSRNSNAKVNIPIENNETAATPKMKTRKNKSVNLEADSENIIIEN